jgi:hypothetical protein
MNKCKLCGAINSVSFIKTSEEEFEQCTSCFGENCFEEIDEGQYYKDKETEARLSTWKEEKDE